jgi:hypothetical protein
MKVYIVWGIETDHYGDENITVDRPFIVGIYSNFEKALEASKLLKETAGTVDEWEVKE